jgi:hypothetical protein
MGQRLHGPVPPARKQLSFVCNRNIQDRRFGPRVQETQLPFSQISTRQQNRNTDEGGEREKREKRDERERSASMGDLLYTIYNTRGRKLVGKQEGIMRVEEDTLTCFPGSQSSSFVPQFIVTTSKLHGREVCRMCWMRTQTGVYNDASTVDNDPLKNHGVSTMMRVGRCVCHVFVGSG